MHENNIVVAFGGISPEHEVSVLTAMQAISALEGTDYRIRPLYITKLGRWMTGEYLMDLEHYQDLDKLESRGVPCTFTLDDLGKPYLLETQKRGLFSSPSQFPIDALIPAFHGSEGENGSFQGICETYNIPYAGSGVLASSLGMNKVRAKDLCRSHGISVIDGIDFYEKEWGNNREQILEKLETFSYPLIVKPVSLGSSIGVAKSGNKNELVNAIETAFRYDPHILVEKAVVPLMEINCSVLGIFDDLQTSVCERPLGKEETLTFEDKYQNNPGEGAKGMASADRVIPADIPGELTEKIQDLSLRIFDIFYASGVARLDFLVNRDTQEVYFNEINTIPGSFSFYLWEESGMSFRELMIKMIEIAQTRFQRKIGRIRTYDTNLLSQKAVQGIKGLKEASGKQDE